MNQRLLCILFFLLAASACIASGAEGIQKGIPGDRGIRCANESLLRSIVAHVAKKYSQISKDHVLIHVDDLLAQEQIGFLNREFKTKTFSRRSNVSYAYGLFDRGLSEVPLQFGMTDVCFAICKDLDDAYRAVISSKRSNFKLKALTFFRVIKRGHSLILVFTETPDTLELRYLFEYVSELANEGAKCESLGPKPTQTSGPPG